MILNEMRVEANFNYLGVLTTWWQWKRLKFVQTRSYTKLYNLMRMHVTRSSAAWHETSEIIRNSLKLWVWYKCIGNIELNVLIAYSYLQLCHQLLLYFMSVFLLWWNENCQNRTLWYMGYVNFFVDVSLRMLLYAFEFDASSFLWKDKLDES